MSSTYQGPVHLLQGGTALEVDGTAGGSIDTPASGGVLPIGTKLAGAVQLGAVCSTIPTAIVPTNSSTITPPAQTNTIVVNPAGATTGNILAAGTNDGQELTIINKTSNTVTMAAAGTSNVADGTSCVIPALKAMFFVWSAANSLWYHT